MIDFNCVNCGRDISLSEEYIGQEYECPGCGQVYMIPAPESAPSTPLQADLPAEHIGPVPQDAVPRSKVAAYQNRPDTFSGSVPYYAGFWKRFAAVLIDGFILGITGAIIGGILGGIMGAVLGSSGTDSATIGRVGSILGGIAGVILRWLYYTLFESSAKQATLGKMALGIIVIDEQGNRISFGRANGRYWAKIISALLLCIGFMMAGFTERKQALHDLIASSFVIRK